MPNRYRKAAAAYLASEMSATDIFKDASVRLLKKAIPSVVPKLRLPMLWRLKWSAARALRSDINYSWTETAKLPEIARALRRQDPRAIRAASDLMAKYLSIEPSPRIAIELAELQRLSNRHDAANQTLRRAVRKWPADRNLWYHAIIYLMRHGEPHEVSELLDTILKVDPDYALARFFKKLTSLYPDFVRSIMGVVSASEVSTKPAYLIGFAVWGRRYLHLFLNYTLASLLADGNLPAASQSHDVHIVVFATFREAEFIRSSPIFDRVSEFARFHFVAYDEALLEIAKSDDHGVAVHARFGLMSAGHHAIAECARRLRCKATILGADNVVNGDFLQNVIKLADARGGASAIVCPGIRLPARALEVVSRFYRGDQGEVAISGKAFAHLLSEFMPAECFADSTDFSRFPLFLCWRVGDEGLLIHANHPHPVMIDGRYLREIWFPSIDPIDGRFLVRNCTDLARIHICSTSEICLFDAADNPLLLPSQPMRRFDADEVGLWLWQFSDGLRERYFAQPVRYPFNDVVSTRWAPIERDAAAKVKQILDSMHSLKS